MVKCTLPTSASQSIPGLAEIFFKESSLVNESDLWLLSGGSGGFQEFAAAEHDSCAAVSIAHNTSKPAT